MIFYIIACMLSSLIALMYLHRAEAFSMLGEAPETDRNLLTELGFGAGLMALALPINAPRTMTWRRVGCSRWAGPGNQNTRARSDPQ